MSSLDQIEHIRHHFDEKSQQWHFSIVDAVGIIAPTSNPRNYWKVLKNRLKKAQNQLVTECNQLKMRSKDGKSYLTDAAKEETILKIVEIISKKDVPDFKEFFDNFSKKESLKKESPVIPQNHKKGTYPQENFELPLDAYQKGNFIFVKAFVAGADIEDIFISATPNTLTIKGQRKLLEEKDSPDYLKKEILWGEFSRKIKMPAEVDVDKIEASAQNGLLTVKLPLLS